MRLRFRSRSRRKANWCYWGKAERWELKVAYIQVQEDTRDQRLIRSRQYHSGWGNVVVHLHLYDEGPLTSADLGSIATQHANNLPTLVSACYFRADVWGGQLVGTGGGIVCSTGLLTPLSGSRVVIPKLIAIDARAALKPSRYTCTSGGAAEWHSKCALASSIPSRMFLMSSLNHISNPIPHLHFIALVWWRIPALVSDASIARTF
jgi:hypothetical protein